MKHAGPASHLLMSTHPAGKVEPSRKDARIVGLNYGIGYPTSQLPNAQEVAQKELSPTNEGATDRQYKERAEDMTRDSP